MTGVVGVFAGLIPGLKLTDGTLNILSKIVQDADGCIFELTSPKNLCFGTKLSHKAGLSFAGLQDERHQGSVVKPPAELHCPSLFPDLSYCITASSQPNP